MKASEGARLVQQTTRASFVVQVITGLVGLLGLTYQPAPNDKILKDLLGLELGVQAFELIFYMAFLFILNLNFLSELRYFDWFFSTPVMLFTMSCYFLYEQKPTEPLTPASIWQDHKQPLVKIAIANALMLAFGLLGEYGILSRWTAFLLGTAAFILSFATLYTEFVGPDFYSNSMFGLLTLIWGGYGVAFLQTEVVKNISYNILDVIAKNFFGLFLVYKLNSVRAPAQTDTARTPEPGV